MRILGFPVKCLWRLLLLAVLAGGIVALDKQLYPEVAFTPILCVIGLLVLALSADLTTVCLAFPVFFVAVLISLLQTTSFDPAQPAHVARVWLRMGGFTVSAMLAVFMCIYRIRVQRQLKEYVDLFQSLPLPIVVTNENWVILDGNLEAATFVGVDAKKLTNKSYDTFFRIICADEIEQEWFNKWSASSEAGVFHAHLAVKKHPEQAHSVSADLYKLGFGRSVRVITVLRTV